MVGSESAETVHPDTPNPIFNAITLEVYKSGLRIRPSIRLFKILCPDWQAHYRDLTEVAKYRATGIRFSSQQNGTIEWFSYQQASILGLLQSLGVDVT